MRSLESVGNTAAVLGGERGALQTAKQSEEEEKYKHVGSRKLGALEVQSDI